MTDTLHSHGTGPQQPLRPFARDPQRWDEERSRALRFGHVCRETVCAGTGEPALVYERTGWGWLGWRVPSDGTPPKVPSQIGVFTPGRALPQRLAVRWLTRRPARRIALTATSPASLRYSAAAMGAVSFFAALFALSRGIPADVVLPTMLLAPLLTEHLPERLDERARTHVRSVEGDDACHYLQRLAALHTYIVQAAADSDRYELRRSAEIGHNLLWGAADLLQNQDTRTTSTRLVHRERLMAQLADQVAQILQRTRAAPTADEAVQPRSDESPLGPLPPGFEPASRPTPPPTNDISPRKGFPPMTQTRPDDTARTTDVYLLFAHEPYYPSAGTQEINTTLVAADTLLHPQVQQPDGARIHDRLTRGRQPGEIIPLATLTHELGGGADWPAVGDWENVITDLLQLVRAGECDALSLGLPDIARALIIAGPHSQVRAFDAGADELITYGPNERAAVLAEIDTFLTCLVAEQDLWPGDGLLPPLFQQA
ncbi:MULTISPECIES: hypothetical protein [Streptomyces]|nr:MULTISPECIES: hypothetical protein [Streptomyces]MDI5907018.1 hypothetical protein [Streptomyces sp. 12257]